MANRQRAEARRKAAAKAAKDSNGSKLWMWVTLGVVVVAGIIGTVVVLSSGDDDGDDGDATEETTSGSTFPDSQPVTITGDDLPAFEGPYGSQQEDPAFATAAPVLEGKNFQGDAVTVDGTQNGPTMVVFLAHWCPHCNAEVPRLARLEEQWWCARGPQRRRCRHRGIEPSATSIRPPIGSRPRAGAGRCSSTRRTATRAARARQPSRTGRLDGRTS